MEISAFFEGAMWLFSSLLMLPVTLWNWGRRRFHMVYMGSKFPGPFSLPLVGNALDAGSGNSAAIYQYGIKIFKLYAPLVRYYIGPILVVSSMQEKDNEKILSGHKYVNKSVLYNKFLEPWLGDGLLLSSGKKWRSRRKALTPAFHFKILDQFQPIFQSCGDEFVRQLRMRAGGPSVDVWPLVKLLTLDIICETAMGVKLGAQTDSSSEYVSAVEEISHLTVHRLLQPWLHPDFIFYLSPTGRKYKRCLKVLHDMTDKVIRERREELLKIGENIGNTNFDIDELGRRRRVAFLDLLLMESRNGNLTDADIREEVDTFMFEGHDTTASAISFTMFLLSRHQDVQKKILEELQTVFDSSQPLEPTMQQLGELKYLEMVIKESLRLYPPVMVIYRDVTEDDTLPTTGHVLPSGAVMEVSIFGTQHYEGLWPDAERFDPERFSPEESAKRHPYAYLPFSAGPRNCIGQRFALLEMKSILAKVVWNFRIVQDTAFEPIMCWRLIIKSDNGLRMLLENRR